MLRDRILKARIEHVEVLELTSHEYIVLVMGDIKQRETKGKKIA